MKPQLSTAPTVQPFLAPNDIVKGAMNDWSRGGAVLNSAQGDLNVKSWEFTFDSSTFEFKANGQPVYTHTDANIIWLSGTFDQNMRPTLAYTETDGSSTLYFYNAQIAAFDKLALGQVTTPFVSMDDIRLPEGGINDVILTYIKNGSICTRIQRDRFTIEYTLVSGLAPGSKIRRFGMTQGLRLRWELGD